jgi:transposase
MIHSAPSNQCWWIYQDAVELHIVVAELESGKPLAQIACEQSIHLGLPTRWREELAENPEKAFSGNGNQYKDQARIAELERLLG